MLNFKLVFNLLMVPIIANCLISSSTFEGLASFYIRLLCQLLLVLAIN